MYKFSIWVDADSFPQKARSYVLSLASSKKILAVFVANREILKSDSNVKMVVCKKEKDAADDYIFDNLLENDIVLTRDILFAARLVERKITVMNDRGLVFNKDNIEDKLREREFSLNMSQIGLGGNKSSYYGEKELGKFSRALEQKVQEHIMNETYNIKRY